MLLTLSVISRWTTTAIREVLAGNSPSMKSPLAIEYQHRFTEQAAGGQAVPGLQSKVFQEQPSHTGRPVPNYLANHLFFALAWAM